MIVIKKGKGAREVLKLFSVELGITPDTENHFQLCNNIKGHKTEITALLEGLGVDPGEYKAILKHAADALLADFIQQIVNLSDDIKSAGIEEDKED